MITHAMLEEIYMVSCVHAHTPLVLEMDDCFEQLSFTRDFVNYQATHTTGMDRVHILTGATHTTKQQL